jgi:hypothetical protein
VFLMAAIGVLLAGCEHGDSTSIRSGRGAVYGVATNQDFTFAAALVRGVYVESATGEVKLDMRLCESDCEGLGTVLSPDSRAMLFSLSTTATALVAGASFSPSDSFQGLAVRATSVLAPEATHNAGATLVEQARTGALVVDAIDLVAGGSIRGHFQLELDDGGSVHGDFEAPLLLYQEGNVSERGNQ